MNKYYYLVITVFCLVGLSFSPIIVSAESGDDSQSNESVETEVEIEQNSIREKIRSNSGRREENIKDLRRLASSTKAEMKELKKEMRGEIKNIREDGKMMIKNATSSMERKEIKKQMRLDIFKAQKARLISQLTLATNNLKQIRARIATRIEKAETAGKNMTEAKTLLVTADAKILIAVNEVAKLSAFVPTNATSTETNASTTNSAEIDLTKPRQINEAAIKAIKNAHKALIDVVVSIAHNMGARCERSDDNDKIRCVANPTATTTNQTN